MPDPSLLDALLNARAATAGEFTADELGGVTLYLRQLTLGDRLKLVALGADKDRPAPERQAEMVRLCLCDADGRPLFADGDARVMTLPGRLCDRVVDAALKANGLTGRAADQGKA